MQATTFGEASASTTFRVDRADPTKPPEFYHACYVPSTEEAFRAAPEEAKDEFVAKPAEVDTQGRAITYDWFRSVTIRLTEAEYHLLLKDEDQRTPADIEEIAAIFAEATQESHR